MKDEWAMRLTAAQAERQWWTQRLTALVVAWREELLPETPFHAEYQIRSRTWAIDALIQERSK